MNDEEFLELMNLYIDGELHGEKLRHLENEICNHPSRRKIYREYCRIHTATRAHYDVFAEANPEVSARNIRVVQRAVRQMERGRMITLPARWVGWVAGAAAACLVGFVGLQQFGFLETGKNAPGSERAPMTVRETHTFETPVGNSFVTRSDSDNGSNPYERPFSLVRYDNAAEPETTSEGGLFIQHYRIRMHRSGQLAPENFFGLDRPVPTSGPRVFRSYPQDNDADLQLEAVGYRISR